MAFIYTDTPFCVSTLNFNKIGLRFLKQYIFFIFWTKFDLILAYVCPVGPNCMIQILTNTMHLYRLTISRIHTKFQQNRIKITKDFFFSFLGQNLALFGPYWPDKLIRVSWRLSDMALGSVHTKFQMNRTRNSRDISSAANDTPNWHFARKLLKNRSCPKFNLHPLGDENLVKSFQIQLNFEPLGWTNKCGAVAII